MAKTNTKEFCLFSKKTGLNLGSQESDIDTANGSPALIRRFAPEVKKIVESIRVLKALPESVEVPTVGSHKTVLSRRKAYKRLDLAQEERDTRAIDDFVNVVAYVFDCNVEEAKLLVEFEIDLIRVHLCDPYIMNLYRQKGIDHKFIKRLAYVQPKVKLCKKMCQMIKRDNLWIGKIHSLVPLERSVGNLKGKYQSGLAAEGATTNEGEVIAMQAPAGPTQDVKTSVCNVNFSSAAPGASLEQVFHRAYRYPSVYNFSVSSPRFSVLTDLNFPQAFYQLDKLPTKGWLDFHALTRMDFKVTVRIDSTNFHSGMLLLFAVPGYPTEQDRLSNMNWATVFNYPHAYLKIGDENDASLVVPYGSLFPLLAPFNRNNETQCKFYVAVLSPLVSGAGQPASATYSIWIEPQEANVSVKTINVIAQSKPWSPLVHAGLDKVLGQDSIWNKIAKGIGGITGLFDRVHLNEELPEDRKCSDEPIQAVNLKPNMLEMIEDANDRFKIPQIYDLVDRCKVMSLAQIMVWRTGDSANDFLGTFIVSPTNPMLLDTSNNNPSFNSFYATNVFSIASLYRYWRGDMIVTMEVVSTRFHKGQLMISFDPYGTALATVDEISALPCITYTLGQADNRITFKIPYTKHQDYCAVQIPNPNVINQLCRLYVTVQTPLSGPTTVSPQIEVLFYISCGDNFEFKYPVPYDEYGILRQIDGVFQSKVEVSATARETEVIEDVYNDVPDLSLGFMKGSHTDVRTMLRRPEYIGEYTFTVNGSVGPISYLPPNGIHRYLSVMWKYNSGSVNIHVVTNIAKTDKTLCKTRYNSKGGTGFTWNQVTAIPTLSQMWQGVVHTLNTHGAFNVNMPAYREIPFRNSATLLPNTSSIDLRLPTITVGLDQLTTSTRMILSHSCSDEFSLYIPLQMPKIAMSIQNEVSNGLIPQMTGPSTGGVSVTGSAVASGSTAPWTICDRSLANYPYFPGSGEFSYIDIVFPTPVSVNRVFFAVRDINPRPPNTVLLQASTDGSTYIDLERWDTVEAYGGFNDISATQPYNRFRLFMVSPGYDFGIVEFQLFSISVFHNPTMATLPIVPGVYQSNGFGVLPPELGGDSFKDKFLDGAARAKDWAFDKFGLIKEWITGQVSSLSAYIVGSGVSEIVKRGIKAFIKILNYVLHWIDIAIAIAMLNGVNNLEESPGFLKGLVWANFLRASSALGLSVANEMRENTGDDRITGVTMANRVVDGNWNFSNVRGRFQSKGGILDFLATWFCRAGIIALCTRLSNILGTSSRRLVKIIQRKVSEEKDVFGKIKAVIDGLLTWLVGGDRMNDELIFEAKKQLLDYKKNLQDICNGVFGNREIRGKPLAAREYIEAVQEELNQLRTDEHYFTRTACILSLIKECSEEIRKAKLALVSSVGIEPVTFTLYGPSGCGKGELLGKYLPLLINKRMEKIETTYYTPVKFENEEDYQLSNGRLVHILTTNTNKKYDSRYCGQPFIHFDDAFTENGTSNDAMTLVQLINTSRNEVIKADVSDKGEVYRSPFVFISTNVKDVPNVCKTNIIEPEKLNRRLGLFMEIRPKSPEFQCNFQFLDNCTTEDEFEQKLDDYIFTNYDLIPIMNYGRKCCLKFNSLTSIASHLIAEYHRHAGFTPGRVAMYACGKMPGKFQSPGECAECCDKFVQEKDGKVVKLQKRTCPICKAVFCADSCANSHICQEYMETFTVDSIPSPHIGTFFASDGKPVEVEKKTEKKEFVRVEPDGTVTFENPPKDPYEVDDEDYELIVLMNDMEFEGRKDTEQYRKIAMKYHDNTGFWYREWHSAYTESTVTRWYKGLKHWVEEHMFALGVGAVTIAIVGGVISVIGIVKTIIFGILGLMQGSHQASVYDSLAVKTTAKHVSLVHGIPQSFFNQNDEDMIRRIRYNNLPIRLVLDGKVVQQQFCLFLTDSEFLVNYHFIISCHKWRSHGAVVQIAEYTRCGDFVQWRPVCVTEDTVDEVDYHLTIKNRWTTIDKDCKVDMVKVTVPIRWPNIRKISNLIYNPDVLKEGDVICLIDRVNPEPMMMNAGGGWCRTESDTVSLGQRLCATAFPSNRFARPVDGDCGRVYFKPGLGIIGMHSFMGFDNSTFGFTPISQYKQDVIFPEIMDDVQVVPTTSGYWHSGPLYNEVECDLGKIELFNQSKSMYTRLLVDGQPIIIEEECDYMPSCKKIITVDGEKVNPLLKGSAKYEAKALVCCTPRYLDQVVDKISSKVVGTGNPRLLTLSEVVNGLPDDEAMLSHLNMKSSSGIWAKWFQGGKRELFDVDVDDGVNPKTHKFSAKARNYKLPNGRTFVEQVEWVEQQLDKGQVPFMPYLSTLKDELRPKRKVEIGKTRVFEMNSTDLCMIWRKHCGAFCDAYKRLAGFKMYHGIGKDKEEVWKHYAEGLKFYGDRGFAFDYSNFDGSVPVEAFYVFEKVMDKFYGGPSIVRSALISQMKNGNHIMGQYLFESSQGNKSGNAMTDVFNSIANTMLMMMCYMSWQVSCRETPSLFNFDRDIRMLTYGDDLIVVPKPKLIINGFNATFIRDTVAALGLTITSARKDGSFLESEPFEELTFLKSPFIYDKELKVWLCPLPIEDIMKELTYRPKCMENNASDLAQRTNNVLRFLSHHTPEVFEEWSKKLSQRGLDLQGFSRESYLKEVRIKQLRAAPVL